jgi:hypothetical protein
MIHMISLPGFRTTWRDTPETPPEPDDDQGDHGEPVPEDEEFDSRPDQADMDAAIADFFKRLEAQERDLYAGLHGALSRLPVPGKEDLKAHSVNTAMEAGMLPRMDDEEARRFTPSEVLLYQHAQDHRYVCLMLWFNLYNHGMSW